MLKQTSYRALCQALFVIAAITFQSVPAPRTGGVFAKAETIEKKNAPSENRQKLSAAIAPPQRTPAPNGGQVLITATKRDAFPNHGDGLAHEGDTITYTVVVTNNGDTDAIGVAFNDVVDGNTSTLVGPGVLSPVLVRDAYSAIGNVRINTANIVGPGHSVTDNDAVTNGGVLSGFGNSQATANGTVPNGVNTVTTANGGTVTMNPDGTFTFDPAPGFTGADSFFYAVTSPTTGTGTGQVTISISNTVWFINNSGANGDGRLTAPFNSIANYNASAPTKDPGDIVFIYQGSGPYTGNLILVNGMQLIGQGVDLATGAGLTVPPASDPLPTATANPDIDSSAGDTVTLASGNNIRGLNLRNSAGRDLVGSAFGTLTVSAVGLTGTGRPLDLTNGILAATFNGITSTSSSGGQGIALTSVSGSMSVIGGTAITNPSTQGILVSGSTANIDFGNTTISGGTNGVSLQNNSAGTRTFGTLSISNSSGAGNPAFLHAVGGGVTVAGTTTITNPAGTGIDIQSSTTLITFGPTTVNKNSTAGTGVNLGGAVTGNSGNVTFNSLDITTSNGSGLIGAENTGIVTVASNAGGISAIGGPALNITKSSGTSPVSVNFANVSSNSSGTQGVNLSNVSGTIAVATGGTITGATGTGFNVSGGSVTVSYPGNITQSNAQKVVNVQNATGGTLTFSGLVTSNTGTGLGISLTSNTGAIIIFTGGINLSTSNNPAFTATGGGTVNATQNNTTILNTLTTTTGTALNVTNTTIGASNMTFHSISSNGAANGIVLNNTGASGGLIVTGDGNTSVGGNSSGGTIQNATNNGILLTTTQSPSFTNLNIHDIARSGIDGQSVTNFTLANSTINNVGTAAAGQYEESNVAFNDNGAFNSLSVSGTVSITQNTLTNARRQGIDIQNGLGTISSLTIQNNVITSSASAASSLGDAIHILAQGSASTTSHVTTGSITGNTISNFPSGAGIFVGGGNTAAVTSATLGANGSPIDITNNTIAGQSAVNRMGTNAIQVSFNGLNGVSNFNVSSNPTLSNVAGIGISVFMAGNVAGTTTVNGNTVTANNTAGSSGIAVQVDQATMITDAPNYNFTINNNNVSATEGNGIRAIARNSVGIMDLTIQNNTVTAPTLANRNGIRIDSGSAAGDVTLCMTMTGNSSAGSGVNQGIGLRKQGTIATVNDFGISGLVPSPATAATAAAKVAADNPAGGGVDILSGDNFVSCTVTPIAPPGPDDIALGQELTSPLPAANTQPVPVASVTGSSAAPLFSIGNFEVGTAARALDINRLSSHLRNDDNGSSFATTSTIKLNHLASANKAASDSHRVTFDRSDAPAGNHAPRQSFSANGGPLALLSGGTVTINVGTLSAGSSVTITFQVTVNAAAPVGVNTISNQGTVSGSNFASVVTDDPDTPQPNDPTVTPLLHPTAADGIVSGRVLTEDGTPVEGAVVRLSGGQTRKTITDADGYYQFNNVATGGFYTVTPSRVNYNFNPFNRSFNQLANRTEAAFSAVFTADNTNPLDTAEYFIRQQYVDILGREPDEGGFNYWSERILECGNDLLCVNARRRDVAAAFFIEQEFQQTGSFIYDVYKGALGRRPIFSEYSADRKLVIGGANLEAEKAAFAQVFVQRPEFVQKYQSNATAESFVDAVIANLLQSAGVDLSNQRDTFVARYNTGLSQTESRSFVVRDVAESSTLKQAEYNGAFVLTEYFGYLRREPESDGYAFWLEVLNNREAGNYRGMVCGFITSAEYQRRFSGVVSRSNADCGQ